MDSSSNLSYTAATAASTPDAKQLHFPPPATPKSNVKKRLGWNPKQQLPNEQDSGALSRSQVEANNLVSNSASSTSSDVSTTASLNGSSSSLQSVHGISSSSADNSQSTPRARQGNSTLQDPTLELQAGIDVMQVELVAHTTWRCQEKTEMVGSWKAKIYDMHNVQVGGAQYTKIWSNGCGC